MNFNEFDAMVTTVEQDLAGYKPVTNHDTPEYHNGVSPELVRFILSTEDEAAMSDLVQDISLQVKAMHP